MGGDALEIAQQIQMHRAGLHRGRDALAHALDMGLGGAGLDAPNIDLGIDQLAGKLGITRHEHGLAQLHVRDGALIELKDFGEPFG